MKPLISVIVPIYNVEQYLRKCVDSIISQTYRNLEIILIDDGSPDACGKICDEYALEDERIIVIHKKNGGLSDARNTGINICKGEYISFVDSDDFVSPFFIEIMYSGLEKYDCEISSLQHGVQFMDGQDERVVFAKNENDYSMEEIVPKEAIRLMMYQRLPNGAPWRLYKREIFSDIRFPVGWLYEDAATTHKTFMKAKKMVIVHADVYAEKLISITIGEQIVREVTEYDEELYNAACSRAFAMNYHVFLQIPLRDRESMTRTWKAMKAYSDIVVEDKSAIMRRKNKVASYLVRFGMTFSWVTGRLYKMIQTRKID